VHRDRKELGYYSILFYSILSHAFIPLTHNTKLNINTDISMATDVAYQLPCSDYI